MKFIDFWLQKLTVCAVGVSVASSKQNFKEGFNLNQTMVFV